jgi:putative tryptophan/tyrosine transport system substrate-binding protein
MRRRGFIALVGGAAASSIVGMEFTRAQPAKKQWRIGMLETISAAANAASLNALRNGLRELGYVEGNNLILEYRSAEGAGDRFPDLATELVRQNVDLIVTRGTPAVLAAKAATATIPVVMAAIGEPMLAVASIARPGGNVTGLSAFVTDLQAKRVELLKDVFPGLSRVATMLNMGNPGSPPQWRESDAAARSLGLEAQLLDVRKTGDIEPAFNLAVERRVEAIVVGLDAVTQVNAALIAGLAANRRLATIYASKEFVEVGGLIAYGVSYPDLYRRAATYIDKIFKGARPADLPVEQPIKFELVVNLKAAKALGLDIPATVLARADEVIE